MSSPGARLIQAYVARKRVTGLTPDFRSVVPVCSAVETGNYKNALLLVNKLLKTKPQLWVAHALKALILCLSARPVPSNSVQEILAIIDHLETAANGTALADADIYIFLPFILKSIGHEQRMTSLFATATRAFPQDSDINNEAFLYYARAGEWEKAQQLAVKMAKTHADDAAYVGLSTMTTVLLCRDVKTDNAQLLLSLAERQVSSYHSSANADENETAAKYNDSHEYHLATRLLEVMADRELRDAPTTNGTAPPSSVVKVPRLPSLPDQLPASLREALLVHLESKEAEEWCSKSLGSELQRRELVLRHGETARLERERKRLERRLSEGDTNWHTMLHFIRSSLWRPSDALPEWTPDPQVVDGVRQRFRDLEATERGGKERGYLLAQLEIDSIIRSEANSRGAPTAKHESTQVDGILRYIDRFGSKACCFDDVAPYLAQMSADEKKSVADRLQDRLAQPLQPGSLQACMTTITSAKLCRRLSTGTANESELTRLYLQRYHEALPLGASLPKTELQPADDFALIAAQSLVAQSSEGQDRALLEQALFVLHTALRTSAYNFRLRLLYINVARQLGASSLALAQYQLLRIRSVQYDTLSHVILSRAETFASDPGVAEEALAAVRFYPTAENETSDIIVRAFSTHSYTQIEDLVDFKARLVGSFAKRLATMTMMRIRLLRGLHDTTTLAKARSDIARMLNEDLQETRDNRDYKTLPNLMPEGSDDVWHQSGIASREGTGYLRAILSVYATFLQAPTDNLDRKAREERELDTSEMRLCAFANNFASTCQDSGDEAAAEELKHVKMHFQVAHDNIVHDIEQDGQPGRILHEFSLAFEALCLLDLYVDTRLAETAGKKTPEVVKAASRARAIRTTTRDAFRPISAKLTAYSKQVGKSKTQVAESLSKLPAVEQFGQGARNEFAAVLTESRKQMAEGMASFVHKRLSSIRG